MNSKWYFSALVVILALLGINLEQNTVPNQEIIVEFDNDSVSPSETRNTLSIVTQRLQQLGANQIEVLGNQDGRIKITYYSSQDVASIKRILAGENKLHLDYASLLPNGDPISVPVQDDFNGYELNISEIHHGPQVEMTFTGFMHEFTTLQDRYVSPDVFVTFDETAVRIKNNTEEVAYILYGSTALEIDYNSHNIPEVRAGPNA